MTRYLDIRCEHGLVEIYISLKPHYKIYKVNCSNNDLLNNFSGCVNPLTAKLFNLNFHPLEVVSR